MLGTYGSIYKAGKPSTEKELFCYQHSCRRSRKGYLYLYDNNSCDSGAFPKILMIKEPSSDKEKAKIVWTYECRDEVKSEKKMTGDKFTTGGNVIELPDSSLFVSMCSGYSELFIVDPNKTILWSAIPEKWNHDENMWEATTQYRASMILARKDLEHLILGSDKK